MGMLYYECKKCKRTVGIYGQFVGFVKCESCNKSITNDKDHKFQKYNIKCSQCGFSISFEAMGSIYTRCVKCDIVPKIVEQI